MAQNQEQDEYNRAISDLNSLQSNSQVLALARYKKPETILPLFRRQLALIGIQPEDLNKLNPIHIGGTKGKGSTCAFLESILLTRDDRPGLRVGSYNSPHIVSVTERIRINGRPIARPLFTKYFRHVFDILKQRQQLDCTTPMPSYFAFLTLLAFHIFLEERVDCAIVEVGIGGEYDPTNVIPSPVACAITTLDLEHTNILGNTIKSIAWTKAGIIKPRVPLFLSKPQGEQAAEALESIEARARTNGSPVFVCERLDDRELPLGIKGAAQYYNSGLACQLAKYYLATPEQRQTNWQLAAAAGDQQQVKTLRHVATHPDDLVAFSGALKSSRLAGRCQVIACPDAIYCLDGAHTRKSMENCISWFEYQVPASHRVLMVNVIGERDKSLVLEPLVALGYRFHQIIFTSNRVHATTTTTTTTTTSTTSDQQSSSSDNFANQLSDVNHERGLENVKHNARVWAELVALRSDADAYKQPQIKSSIMESLDSVTMGPRGHRPHVLVTGSLHFVGAVIEALRLRYPESKIDLQH